MSFLKRFRTCAKCNANGFMVEIGDDGYCDHCREVLIKEAEAAEQRRRAEEVAQAVNRLHIVEIPTFHNGGTLAYEYRRVHAIAFNRASVEQMAFDRDYSVELQTIDGGVYAVKYGGPVLQIIDRLDMIEDWMLRGDPVYCAIDGFRAGRESVYLGFYRRLDTWLEGFEYVNGVLTACFDDEMQDVIEDLQDGEMLCLRENDKGKLAVHTVHYGFEIGKLPSKLHKYDESEIKAIVVDHVKSTIRGNGVEALIPHIRVYLK